MSFLHFFTFESLLSYSMCTYSPPIHLFFLFAYRYEKKSHTMFSCHLIARSSITTSWLRTDAVTFAHGQSARYYYYYDCYCPCLCKVVKASQAEEVWNARTLAGTTLLQRAERYDGRCVRACVRRSFGPSFLFLALPLGYGGGSMIWDGAGLRQVKEKKEKEKDVRSLIERAHAG